MRFSIQYVSDVHGKAQAVQLPLAEWQELLHKLKQYEEAFALRSKLEKALQEVEELRLSKSSQPTLTDLLNEL